MAPENNCSSNQQVPDYESILQRAYEAILENGDVVIDVGAHVGRHTFPICKAVYPSGKVYAFEPLPMCRDAITTAINEQYPQYQHAIVLYAYALSDYEGDSSYVMVVDDLAYSGLRERIYDRETKLEKIAVSVKTLDSMFAYQSAIKFIKIDAEGGEYHILRGAKNILYELRPVVSIEFGANSIKEYNIKPQEVWEFLHQHRYKVYDILGRFIDNAESFDKSANLQQVWDYLAIPEGKPELERKLLNALAGS